MTIDQLYIPILHCFVADPCSWPMAEPIFLLDVKLNISTAYEDSQCIEMANLEQERGLASPQCGSRPTSKLTLHRPSNPTGDPSHTSHQFRNLNEWNLSSKVLSKYEQHSAGITVSGATACNLQTHSEIKNPLSRQRARY
jgi:hypothetical protein